MDGSAHVQPSTAWLKAKRTGGNNYLKYMENSNNANHQKAARLLDDFNRGRRREIDLKIIHVRPDAAGAQAYGPGIDSATRVLKSDGRVDRLDVVDVPF